MTQKENETVAKHTPGPWHIGRDCLADRPSFCAIHAGNKSSTAVCSMRVEVPEVMANARLIAAAPDLITALQSAMQFIGDNWDALTDNDPSWQCCEPGWMEPARSAIAKATNPNP